MVTRRFLAVLSMMTLCLVGLTTPSNAIDGVHFTFVCAPGSPGAATYYMENEGGFHACADGPQTFDTNLGGGVGGFYVLDTAVASHGDLPTATGGIASFTLCPPDYCPGPRPPEGTCGTGYPLAGWTCNSGNSSADVTVTLYFQANRTMSTFGSPVDAEPTVNVAQAGRSVPFKFNVTDSTGAPVTYLSAADVTLTSNLSSCDSSAAQDVLETYASGSGLQNLGGGAYQYVFKTPKSWAGSCGGLTVSVGSGGTQTASFRFRS